MREAIDKCQAITGREMKLSFVEDNRIGDHIWWISDISKLQAHLPGWRLTRGIDEILREIHNHNQHRWLA